MSCKILATTALPSLVIADLGITLCQGQQSNLSNLFSRHKLANSADLKLAFENGLIQIVSNGQPIVNFDELCQASGNTTTTVVERSGHCWQEYVETGYIDGSVKTIQLIDRVAHTDLLIANVHSNQPTELWIDGQLSNTLPQAILAGQAYKIIYRNVDRKSVKPSADIKFCKQTNTQIYCWQEYLQKPELANSINNIQLFSRIAHTNLTINNIIGSQAISLKIDGQLQDDLPANILQGQTYSLSTKGEGKPIDCTIEYIKGIQTISVTSASAPKCIALEYSLPILPPNGVIIDFTDLPIEIVRLCVLESIASNANVRAYRLVNGQWADMAIGQVLSPGDTIRYSFISGNTRPTIQALYRLL